MADLPRIKQEIVVEVDDKGSAAKIAELKTRLAALNDEHKELQKRTSVSNDNIEDFISANKRLIVVSNEQKKVRQDLRRAMAEEDQEVKKVTQSHGLLSRVFKDNTSDRQQLTRDVHKMADSFKVAGQAASLFATFITLVKFPALAAGANLATSAIGALGSAAIGLVAALGPMLNLVGLIPAALAGAAGGLGAVLLGSRGITEAIGAGFGAQKAKTAGSTDPVADARKLEDAIRGVSRAQETLSDSQREVTRAQEDLNKAWLDARNNLRDLREEQTRNSNSVARAEISLARAQQRNADTQADEAATALDKKEALLDVSDAQLDLLDAQEKRTQGARDLNEAETKGVANSDAVADATERLSDAQQTVIDNQLELKRAIEDQAKGLQTAKGATDKYKEALAALGPEARKFVETIVGSKDFKSIKRDVQESLFAPLNDGLKLVLRQAPAFKSFLVDSASGVGEIGKALATSIGSQGFGDDLRTLGQGNKGIFESLSKGADHLIQLFRDLAVVGQPFVKEIIDLAVNGLGKFAQHITELRANGGLAAAFQRGLDVAKEFGRILRDAVTGLSGILRAAKPLGDSLLTGLGETMQRFSEFANSFSGQLKMQTFFAQMRPILTETGTLLHDIGKNFFELASTNAAPLAGVISRVRTELLPIIRNLLDSVGDKFFNSLISLVAALGGAMSQLFGDSSPLEIFLGTLTKIFNVIDSALAKYPIIKQLVFLLVTMATAVRALSLAARITGLKALFDLLTSKAVLQILFGNFATGGTGIAGIAGALQKMRAERAAGAVLTEVAEGAEGLVTAAPGVVASFGAMAAAAAPFLIAITAIVAVSAALYLGWRQSTQASRNYKKTLGEITGALKDQDKATRDALNSAIAKRTEERHQEDDLQRAGIKIDDITTGILKGGDAMEAVRRKAVESGEVAFGGIFLDAPGRLKEIQDAWIKTGRVVDGAWINDLGRQFDDYSKAAQDAAQKTINLGIANGDITDELHGNAIAYDLQNQGILGFIANGPNYAAQLDFINGKQRATADSLERQQRAQERLHELAQDPHAVRQSTADRDAAARNAITKADEAGKAEVRLSELILAGKGDTQEGKDAADDFARAREDATRAAEDYGDAEADLATAQAKRRGEDITDQGLLQARQGAYDRLAEFIRPGNSFRNDLDSLIEDVKTAFADTTFSIDVMSSDEAKAWLSVLTGGQAFKVEPKVAPTNGGANSPLLGVIGQTPGSPSQQRPAVWITPKPASASASSLNARGLASGGVVPVGAGFMTHGPTAIVGEGKPQFPEYVIPTDPDHRKSAILLLSDLVKKMTGTPLMAAGGILGNISGALADQLGINWAGNAAVLALNQAAMARKALGVNNSALNLHKSALLDQVAYQHLSGLHADDFTSTRLRDAAREFDMAGGGRSETSMTTVMRGDTIGTSIGNEFNFHERSIVVSDWDSAKEQMQRDIRLRNMTAARGARSSR